MLDPLRDQRLALAADTAAVLLPGRRRLYHRADARFAALVRQQRANQCLAVDPVGLCPPASARRRDRSRIDDVAFDPFLFQDPIDPESVEASFLDDDDRKALPHSYPRLLLELCKAAQQPGDVAAAYRMLRHLFS